jgi:hypothetical protein
MSEHFHHQQEEPSKRQNVDEEQASPLPKDGIEDLSVDSMFGYWVHADPNELPANEQREGIEDLSFDLLYGHWVHGDPSQPEHGDHVDTPPVEPDQD